MMMMRWVSRREGTVDERKSSVRMPMIFGGVTDDDENRLTKRQLVG